uniref:Pentacotripeptide-repeat region of PRORP domain-containing protein n=1 Tax=Percolomonas cosmopolitus TaxID=63605 RepID=A0A7S1KRA8_9EUKA|mmetsp:Transcript_5059/g.18960  ORF Transcript_5059/g.18960 Transcript_5059/m.18960 type:complete len:216 (+) Transcript_5059:1-648(+)
MGQEASFVSPPLAMFSLTARRFQPILRKSLLNSVRRTIYIFPTAEERQTYSEHQIDRFKAIRSMGNPPTLNTYKDLMLTCLAQQQGNLVKLLWNDMFSSGVNPDYEIFSIVLGSCMAERKAGRALAYFSEMQKSGLFPMLAQLKAMSEIMKDYNSNEGVRTFDQLAENFEKLTWDDIEDAVSKLQRSPDFEAYKLFPAEISNAFGISQYDPPTKK